MECPRCKGLMVEDQVFDLKDTAMWGSVWRCIGCGDIVDAVISANRKKQQLERGRSREHRVLVGHAAA